MQIMENEISKEEYDRYSAMTDAERYNAVKSTLPEYIIWGYGYYGCYLAEADGKYFMRIRTGGSCD